MTLINEPWKLKKLTKGISIIFFCRELIAKQCTYKHNSKAVTLLASDFLYILI